MSARNPDRPRLLAHLTLPSAVIDFAIAHERVVVPLKDGLRVIDRRSRAFSTVGQWTSTTAFNSVALAGTLAVLVHDRDVTVVDLSDPQRPHRVGTGHMTYPGDGARDVVTAGRYALCRDYDDVYALDLANPRRPVETPQ